MSSQHAYLRSKLLRDIRRGRMPLSLALTAQPTVWMESLTLLEICTTRRHIGEHRVRKAFEGTGLKPEKTLGELTEQDRLLAVIALRDRWPNLMD